MSTEVVTLPAKQTKWGRCLASASWWALGITLAYLLSLGPVLRVFKRKPPQYALAAWVVVVYGPAMRVGNAIALYREYVEWWDSYDRK